MKKVLFISFLLFALFQTIYTERLLPGTILRIRIVKDVDSVNIGSNRNFYVFNPTIGKKTRVSSGNIYLFRLYKGYISVGKKRISSEYVQFMPYDENSFIYVNGRPYRDIIYIKKNKNKLIVINEIGLEGYLYGILTMETNPEWPVESLKAQAVISRTYAVRNRGKHKSKGFNLCNEVHCQVYAGVNSEDKRTNNAVDATKGEILTYKGELADTLFHSCCGGYTESAGNVWNSSEDPFNYLKSVRCRYCRESKHYIWKNTINEKTIRNKLLRKGYDVNKIVHIKVHSKSKRGRAKKITIRHKKKNRKYANLTLSASNFRLMIGPSVIRSTRFTKIYKKGDSFVFKGKGWGHGVGMCQWGAKGMAEKGHKYKKILKHYYPGTKLKTWDY